MGMCVVTIALFAFRIPLAAKPVQPIEDHAFVALGIAALLAVSWLAPVLLRDLGRTIICGASIAPLLLIANFLGGYPPIQALPALAITLSWLFAMHVLNGWRGVGRVIAVLTILGPAIWYLTQEFAPTPFHIDSPLAALSPTLGAAAIFSHNGWIWTPFWPILLVCIAKTIARLVRRRAQKVSNPTH